MASKILCRGVRSAAYCDLTKVQYGLACGLRKIRELVLTKEANEQQEGLHIHSCLFAGNAPTTGALLRHSLSSGLFCLTSFSLFRSSHFGLLVVSARVMRKIPTQSWRNNCT